MLAVKENIVREPVPSLTSHVGITPKLSHDFILPVDLYGAIIMGLVNYGKITRSTVDIEHKNNNNYFLADNLSLKTTFRTTFMAQGGAVRCATKMKQENVWEFSYIESWAFVFILIYI